ncbi:MAG: glycosyltransferase family 4 protein [Pseudorhodoplanes sp.]
MADAAHALNILHVFRSPVGGLFRHVLDLAQGQSARGHKVGIVADSLTGGEAAGRAFADLSGSLALGLLRIPMGRQLDPRDLSAVRAVRRRIAEVSPDIVHGHGAKGAAYARLAAPGDGPVRAYTPHGGSLHYRPGTPAGLVYLTLEKFLRRRTDLFLFESAYAQALFQERVGTPALARVVHNGVSLAQWSGIAPAADATDLVFVGELRLLKGVQVLLEALAALRERGQRVSATLAGDGPDRDAFRAQCTQLGLDQLVRFTGPMPAREAFARGRVLVIPSLGESLPYIVLEAAAAALPMIVTRVGGIPEIYGPLAHRLIAAGDPAALAAAIAAAVNDPATMRATGAVLQRRIGSDFSLDRMVESGLAAYRDALQAKRGL